MLDLTTLLEPASKRLDEGVVLQRARENLESVDRFESVLRDAMIEDWRMRSGRGHWSDREREARMREGRPMVTINRLPTMVRGVVADQQQRRLAIKFSAVDAEPSERVWNRDGTKDYSLAQVYEGLAREIERRSFADEAYDWGFTCAVTGGVGYWRVTTRPAPGTVGQSEICIKRVISPFAVSLDPDALLKGPDEANFGLVSEWFDRKAFHRKYPGAADFEGRVSREPGLASWWREGQIRVAEYMVRVREKRTFLLLNNGRSVDSEAYWANRERLAAEQVVPIRDEEHEVPVVQWYLLSGREVLEGPVTLPTQYIPVVPCYGDLVLDGQDIVPESLIRHAHDAQRSINVFETALTEKALLAPRSPWIAEEGQVDGRQAMWRDANKRNFGALVYKRVEGEPPPQRAIGAQMEPGLVERAQSSHVNLEHTLGRYKDDMGGESNAQSGIQTRLRQAEGDAATTVFHSSYRRAIRYTGVILGDMIPRVYDGTRITRMTLADGKEDHIAVNVPAPDMSEDRARGYRVVHDLTQGRFDVAVDAAPSAATQRGNAEALYTNVLSALGAGDPALVRVLLPKLFSNSDVAGAAELARELDALVPPEAKAAREEGGQDDRLAPDQVQLIVQQAVQEALAKAGLEVERMKAEADQMEAQSKMVKAQLDQQMLVVEKMEAVAKRRSAEAQLMAAEADLIEARRGRSNVSE